MDRSRAVGESQVILLRSPGSCWVHKQSYPGSHRSDDPHARKSYEGASATVTCSECRWIRPSCSVAIPSSLDSIWPAFWQSSDRPLNRPASGGFARFTDRVLLRPSASANSWKSIRNTAVRAVILLVSSRFAALHEFLTIDDVNRITRYIIFSMDEHRPVIGLETSKPDFTTAPNTVREVGGALPR